MISMFFVHSHYEVIPLMDQSIPLIKGFRKPFLFSGKFSVSTDLSVLLRTLYLFMAKNLPSHVVLSTAK